jgi:hypothetical protein
VRAEMKMNEVKREQFEFLSDLEVRHVPTDARISTYRYENPDDACSTIHVNFGRDRLENGEEYTREDIKRVACDLLRERARQASK